MQCQIKTKQYSMRCRHDLPRILIYHWQSEIGEKTYKSRKVWSLYFYWTEIEFSFVAWSIYLSRRNLIKLQSRSNIHQRCLLQKYTAMSVCHFTSVILFSVLPRVKSCWTNFETPDQTLKLPIKLWNSQEVIFSADLFL